MRLRGLGCLLLLASCYSARSQLPVVAEDVELRVPTEQLVCHVRSIAADQKLSFHYGTSEQTYGTMATFRLIGEGFEVVAYNPERAHTYVLQAYDMSSKGDESVRAQRAFAAFRTAFLAPVGPACAR